MKKDIKVKKERKPRAKKVKELPPNPNRFIPPQPVAVPEELKAHMDKITTIHEDMEKLLWHAVDLYGTTPNEKFKNAQDSIVIVINMFKALNREYANLFLTTLIPDKKKKAKKVKPTNEAAQQNVH